MESNALEMSANNSVAARKEPVVSWHEIFLLLPTLQISSKTRAIGRKMSVMLLRYFFPPTARASCFIPRLHPKLYCPTSSHRQLTLWQTNPTNWSPAYIYIILIISSTNVIRTRVTKTFQPRHHWNFPVIRHLLSVDLVQIFIFNISSQPISKQHFKYNSFQI